MLCQRRVRGGRDLRRVVCLRGGMPVQRAGGSRTTRRTFTNVGPLSSLATSSASSKAASMVSSGGTMALAGVSRGPLRTARREARPAVGANQDAILSGLLFKRRQFFTKTVCVLAWVALPSARLVSAPGRPQLRVVEKNVILRALPALVPHRPAGGLRRRLSPARGSCWPAGRDREKRCVTARSRPNRMSAAGGSHREGHTIRAYIAVAIPSCMSLGMWLRWRYRLAGGRDLLPLRVGAPRRGVPRHTG